MTRAGAAVEQRIQAYNQRHDSGAGSFQSQRFIEAIGSHYVLDGRDFVDGHGGKGESTLSYLSVYVPARRVEWG
jgi:hypothetical protein